MNTENRYQGRENTGILRNIKLPLFSKFKPQNCGNGLNSNKVYHSTTIVVKCKLQLLVSQNITQWMQTLKHFFSVKTLSKKETCITGLNFTTHFSWKQFQRICICNLISRIFPWKKIQSIMLRKSISMISFFLVVSKEKSKMHNSISF